MGQRGPMPMIMRVGILAFFTFVFLIIVTPMCLGGTLFAGRTAMFVNEYAPTEEDLRFAEELSAAATDAGRDLDVSAIEIAHARRLGQLEEVEIAADELLEGRLRADEVERPPPPKKQARGAFYRDDAPAEPERRGWSLRFVALAFLGASLFIASLGAAFVGFRMFVRPDDGEPPQSPTF